MVLLNKKKPRIHNQNGNYFIVMDCDDKEQAVELKKEINKIRNKGILLEVKKEAPIVVYGSVLEEVEMQIILSVLKSCNNNKTHAAKLLGISIRTLRSKVNGRQLNFS